MRHPSAIGAWIALTILAFSQVCFADSALPLLSGFDRDRIDAVYPPTDEASLGELAKLVYRIRSLDPNTLKGLAEANGEPVIGDKITVDGTMESVTALAVPARLVEFLEFSKLFVIDIQESDRKTRLFTVSLPDGVQQGDRVSAVSVVISISSELDDDAIPPFAVVSNSVRWFPKAPKHAGQQLLSESGFDLGLLPEVAAHNRRPLLVEDGDAFYSMLASAALIGVRPDLPAPTPADPVALLRSPRDMAGQWVHMDLESVQITRISVTESHRQSQLGSDHYFQIDAVGDLEGVVIKIEHSDPSIPPATFQGRYPVSIVTTELPEFFLEPIRARQGGEAVIASIRWKFAMDGFFYRLWGYESDFMAQHGGGQQFGPLLVAARFQNLEPESDDPIGVGIIGTVAAIVIVSGMVMIWWWQRRAWAADEAARRRRQESQSDQLTLPQ